MVFIMVMSYHAVYGPESKFWALGSYNTSANHHCLSLEGKRSLELKSNIFCGFSLTLPFLSPFPDGSRDSQTCGVVIWTPTPDSDSPNFHPLEKTLSQLAAQCACPMAQGNKHSVTDERRTRPPPFRERECIIRRGDGPFSIINEARGLRGKRRAQFEMRRRKERIFSPL